MKAPDKIYIPSLLAADVVSYKTDGGIEYIRKDALLEWAKEQKKDCERIIKEHPEDESLWCEKARYDELIDKIRTL